MASRDDITGRGCVAQQGSVEEPVCVAASASGATVRVNQRTILPEWSAEASESVWSWRMSEQKEEEQQQQ